ncbi:MAG: hypothetical protein ABI162_18325 [Luteolibacter sp.]
MISFYHSPAASGALAGGMWNLTVTERPQLAIERKGAACGRMKW